MNTMMGQVRYFWPALSYGKKGKLHVELRLGIRKSGNAETVV